MNHDDELRDLERRQYGGDGPALTAADLTRLAALQRASASPSAGKPAADRVAPPVETLGERPGDADPSSIPPSSHRRRLTLPRASTQNVLLAITAAALIVVGAFFAGRTSSGTERVAAGVPPIAAKTASTLSWDDGSTRFVAVLDANTVFSGTSDGGVSRCVAVIGTQTREPRLHLCAPVAARFPLAGGIGLTDEGAPNASVAVDWDKNGVPTITPPGGLRAEGSTSKNAADRQGDGEPTLQTVHDAFMREMSGGTGEIQWLGRLGPYQLWHARSSAQRCVAAFLASDTPQTPGLSAHDSSRVVCDVPDADRFVLDFPAVSASRTTRDFPAQLTVELTNTGDVTIRARH